MSGKTYSFRIQGLARSWRAPQFNRKTGAIYKPAQEKVWQQSVAIQAFAHKPSKPHTGPVELVLTFLMPIPKSWPQWKREYARGRLIQARPDVGNLEKACTDALKGIFWIDDQQVAIVRASKWYPLKDEDIGVVVGVIFHDPLPERKPKVCCENSA